MANRRQLEEGYYLIEPQAKEMITVSDSVKSLTSGTYGTNSRASIQCQDADVRYWITGDDPTAAEGQLLYDQGSIELRTSTELANFRAIRDDVTDAKLAVQYYA